MKTLPVPIEVEVEGSIRGKSNSIKNNRDFKREKLNVKPIRYNNKGYELLGPVHQLIRFFCMNFAYFEGDIGIHKKSTKSSSQP